MVNELKAEMDRKMSAMAKEMADFKKSVEKQFQGRTEENSEAV